MHRLAPSITLFATLAGCANLLGLDDVTVGGDPVDALPDSAVCAGDGLLRACVDEAPSSTLMITSAQQFDTSGDPSCIVRMSGTTQVCVLFHDSIRIESALRVIGVRPLMLVSMTSIVVAGPGGSIDVSSGRGKAVGAGGNASVCSSGQAAGSYDGGAGGSFGGRGGSGGDSDSNGRNLPESPVINLMELRGGCRGVDGANTSTVPRGGAGGGGVYLLAKELITIDGTINASGAGGDGGEGPSDGNGGGGGGTGGLIGLEAPFIGGTGVLFANGGGGGGGGGASSGQPGTDPTSVNTPGRGGSNGGAGTGVGGDGGFGSVLAIGGANGGIGTGAGGGGGGTGIIFIKGPRPASIQMSPGPTVR